MVPGFKFILVQTIFLLLAKKHQIREQHHQSVVLLAKNCLLHDTIFKMLTLTETQWLLWYKL